MADRFGATSQRHPDRVSRRSFWKLVAVFVVCAGVIGAAAVIADLPRKSSTVGDLAALPVPARPMDGRLTGFRYAPLRRGTSAPARLSLTTAQWKAIGSIMEQASGNGSERPRHAEAVAYLVLGNANDAIELLAPIAEQSHDASIWSDLAAAYMARAGTESPAFFVDAVAAADAALEIESDHAEARFNRALAVERLGLRDEARNAWKAFLEIEPAGGWAEEARQHHRMLASPLESFEAAVKRDFMRLLAGDRDAAANLVQHFPRESRARVELEELPSWAAARRRDPAAAGRHLAFARSIGVELAERGDRFVVACVGAIDRADESTLEILGEAHVAYGQGWQIWAEKRPTAAEPLLRGAASRFTEVGSPMALACRYHEAVAVFDQNRIAEARAILEKALRDTPGDYPTVRAQILWQLGRFHGAEANWGAAIQMLSESATAFDRIGEKSSASVVRQILSEVYDAIGDSKSARNVRFDVLRQLGLTTNLRTQTAVSAISYDAAQHRRWRVASSFLNIEIGMAPGVGDPPSYVDALLRRAVANHFLGRGNPAARDLSEAARLTREMTDDGLRTRALADVLAVEALLASTSHEAVAKLTTAIDFHRTHGRRMYLPAFYLQRGQALRRAGDEGGARRDFEEGIAVLEEDRQTLPDATSRLGIFDASEDLFAEAIGEALSRGDDEGAFVYAEKARARALLDSMGPPADVLSSVPEQTAVIEFVFLPQQLVTFVLERGRISAIKASVRVDVIAAQAARYRDAFVHSREGDAARLGHSLHAALIDPIANRIAAKKELVFVPDHHLASIPFAALRKSGGRFLVEDHAVVVAPSAAVFVRARGGARLGRAKHVLVLAAPGGPGNGARLQGALREAELVAKAYPRSITLLGDDASSSAFLRHAVSAEVIHFTGHGLSEVDDRTQTSLVFVDGMLGQKAIESLKLDRTPVVVLAGCNTARGEVRWTEGTLSMARAFLAGGASSVIATLWPISDLEAAGFFPSVHRHLADGKPPAEALRAAQLETKDRLGIATWAAVQVIGQ